MIKYKTDLLVTNYLDMQTTYILKAIPMMFYTCVSSDLFQVYVFSNDIYQGLLLHF